MSGMRNKAGKNIHLDKGQGHAVDAKITPSARMEEHQKPTIVIDPCYNKPLPRHLNFPAAPKTFYARPIQILYALVYHLFTPKQVNQHRVNGDPKEPSLPAMPCRKKLKRKKLAKPQLSFFSFFSAIICEFFSTYLYACYTMGAAL